MSQTSWYRRVTSSGPLGENTSVGNVQRVCEFLRGNPGFVDKLAEFRLTDTTCGVTERRAVDDRKTILVLS